MNDAFREPVDPPEISTEHRLFCVGGGGTRSTLCQCDDPCCTFVVNPGDVVCVCDKCPCDGRDGVHQ